MCGPKEEPKGNRIGASDTVPFQPASQLWSECRSRPAASGCGHFGSAIGAASAFESSRLSLNHQPGVVDSSLILVRFHDERCSVASLVIRLKRREPVTPRSSNVPPCEIVEKPTSVAARGPFRGAAGPRSAYASEAVISSAGLCMPCGGRRVPLN